MSRGRKIVKTIEYESCTIEMAKYEFFKSNSIKGLADSTQGAYQNYVNEFARWFGEESLVVDVNLRILDDYCEYKLSKGIKTISLATAMNHLRRFFRFCHSRGYMEYIDLTIPKYDVELKEPYSDEELVLLLKKPTSDNWVELRNWCMINYFFSTGQRLSTVLNIKVKDVDLDARKVKLTWNKDKIQKYMPLSVSIVEILKDYIYVSALQEEDYLFPEYEGGILKRSSANSAIRIYNETRGVTKTSIHLLRHTFAKKYIMSGGHPAKLQQLLNHKTIEMSMKYVNLYGEDISSDYDIHNPLDNFNKNNGLYVKRRKISEICGASTNESEKEQ